MPLPTAVIRSEGGGTNCAIAADAVKKRRRAVEAMVAKKLVPIDKAQDADQRKERGTEGKRTTYRALFILLSQLESGRGLFVLREKGIRPYLQNRDLSHADLPSSVH